MTKSKVVVGTLSILLPVCLWAEPTAVHLTANTDWTAAENGSEDGMVLTAANTYYTVKGRFILKSGATVELGATTPTFESVKFEDGTVLKVKDSDGARLNAPGGITLKSGTVTLNLSDVAEVQDLNREVLALGASGLTAGDFTIAPASLANKMKLVVKDGVLRCKRNTDVVVIIC